MWHVSLDPPSVLTPTQKSLSGRFASAGSSDAVSVAPSTLATSAAFAGAASASSKSAATTPAPRPIRMATTYSEPEGRPGTPST